MECQAIQLWTFARLVGAYLDLAIAFLLLCGSSLAYTVSRFLAFFGMSLPCPCNGMFGDPNKDHCLQSFLVEHPTQNISAVQMSVKHKFPYSLMLSKDFYTIADLRAKGDGDYGEYHDYLGKVKSFGSEGVSKFGRFRPKELSRSKKRNRLGYLRLSSGASNGRVISNVQDTIGTNQEIASQGMVSVPISIAGNSRGVQKVSIDEGSSSKCFSSDEIAKDIKPENEDITTLQECGSKAEAQQEVTHAEENVISLLEQALEEERSARAALYVELEEERSAAASAADEAMAMILRLQEEKAIVEMGARQYKRMVEEKSVFDAEEMNLLKEILLRRERETHFLQMEVEAYRQMIAGNVQLHGVSRLELPDLKWHDSDQGATFQNHKDSNLAHFGTDEEGASSVQEEVIVPEDTTAHIKNVEKNSSVAPSLVEELDSLRRSVFLENAIIPSREKEEHKDEINSLLEVIQTVKNGNIGENPDGCGTAVCEPELHIHDVHVTDSHPNTSVTLQTNETEGGCKKISLRRNSMSSVECERLRIESEVGLLREKIRMVQEGRDKLNLSLDKNESEREKLQLQVLDDMAIQLQEIRDLTTTTGSVARQSSLPPQSSKLKSRKRRHQTSSPGLTNKQLLKEV